MSAGIVECVADPRRALHKVDHACSHKFDISTYKPTWRQRATDAKNRFMVSRVEAWFPARYTDHRPVVVDMFPFLYSKSEVSLILSLFFPFVFIRYVPGIPRSLASQPWRQL